MSVALGREKKGQRITDALRTTAFEENSKVVCIAFCCVNGLALGYNVQRATAVSESSLAIYTLDVLRSS